MTMYILTFSAECTNTVEIEADSLEEAIDIGYGTVDACLPANAYGWEMAGDIQISYSTDEEGNECLFDDNGFPSKVPITMGMGGIL